MMVSSLSEYKTLSVSLRERVPDCSAGGSAFKKRNSRQAGSAILTHGLRYLRARHWRWPSCSAIAIGALLVQSGAIAASVPEVPKIGNAGIVMNAYVKTFYVSDGKWAGHFSAEPAVDDVRPEPFWNQAEEIEAVEDAAERDPRYTSLVVRLLNGFVQQYGIDWTSDTNYNDDMMWATIAFTRGYDLSGDPGYLLIAKYDFDAAYARGLNPANGALWWDTSDTVQNPAVEGPASLAAALLASRLNAPSYKQKSLTIFKFEARNFLNKSTGGIFTPQKTADASNLLPGIRFNIHDVYTTVHQGTFIEDAILNGYPSLATATADYLMGMGKRTRFSDGYRILPDYHNPRDESDWGANSIAVRWVYKFAKQTGLLERYLPWLQANAAAAFSVRNSSDNSWENWFEPSPADRDLRSWMCVSGLAVAQLPTQRLARAEFGTP